ncbi:WYL domain-containing protein [Streptomyces roseirectus]|uniref:WYL domain-containing protein n=1 Tax=Streptomyces roseirectus TaxID=2768066 RepID=A0A7H0IQG0_9ACTN|nr:WYL domain-containing protein [Streptomyces roseirectus]QNP75026.1 WYL domain-containing protein [Streptomyces roseirectus]
MSSSAATVARTWASPPVPRARSPAARGRSRAGLRLSPGVFARLPDLVEPVVCRAARVSAGEPEADGWVRVVVPVESARRAVEMVLRFGTGAEVVGPAEVRERMARTVAELAGRYGR